MSRLNFGITKDTRSEGNVLFSAPKKLKEETPQFPNGYKFPVGTLVNVVADPEKETKDGNKSVIMFVFKGKDGEQYTHIEWEIDTDDDKFEKRVESMQGRIKHILEQTGLKLPENGLGVGATTFTDLFKSIADYFNSQVKEFPPKKEGEQPRKVKIYSLRRVYLKLTYYKTNLGFPMFPNFIQLAEDKDGKPVVCKLTVDFTYDKIEPTTTNTSSSTNFGENIQGGNIGDLPTFE